MPAPLLNFCWELRKIAKPATPELTVTEFDVLKSEKRVKTVRIVFYNSFLRSMQLEESEHPGSKVSHCECWFGHTLLGQGARDPTPMLLHGAVGTCIGLKTGAQREDGSAC